MAEIADTPEPPYYAVIFVSRRSGDHEGYAAAAERMVELARRQPGFLGIETVREGEIGMTVSYWRDEGSIRAWKAEAEHREARRMGRERWYQRYALRVARVERAYGFERPGD